MPIQDTSISCYEELLKSGVIGDRQRVVYDALCSLGTASDVMLADYLGKKDPNFVRPRRKELVDLGLVMAWEKRECPVTHMVVWFWTVASFPLTVHVKENDFLYAVVKKDFNPKNVDVAGLCVFGKRSAAEHSLQQDEMVRTLRLV